MKKINKILILFIAILIIPITTKASILEASDSNLTLDGDYNSTKVLAGDNITNNANIDGLTFIFGNNIKNNGTLSYGFIAGNDITINSEIEKDLFIAGNNVTIESDAAIPRDIYIAGNKVVVKTNIGRTLYVACDTLDLRDITINGNVKSSASTILVNDNTVINGTLYYSEDTSIGNLDKANINNTEVISSKEYKVSIFDTIMNVIIAIITLYFTLAILFNIFNKFKDNMYDSSVEISDIVHSIFTGLIGLIIIPFAAIFLMMTTVLLPISLVMIGLYILGIYLSYGIAGVVVGKSLSKLIKKDIKWYLELLIGIVIVNLVCLIPYIGSVISPLLLFYGFGRLIESFILLKNKK